MSMESLPPDQSGQPETPRCIRHILAEITETHILPKDAFLFDERLVSTGGDTVAKLGCLAGDSCMAWRIIESSKARGTWRVPRRPLGNLLVSRYCDECKPSTPGSDTII